MHPATPSNPSAVSAPCVADAATASAVFPPAPVPLLPIAGMAAQFPVHRIYCVGRNYAAHAREMGGSDRELPFFFLKPADAALPGSAKQPARMPYPPLTADLHHEVELVVAIGQGGSHIAAEQAARHIFGYAVGLDMTRRDLQSELRQQGRPWCMAKGFEASAPIGPIVPAAHGQTSSNARQQHNAQTVPSTTVAMADMAQAEIRLTVNGQLRQQGNTAQMIWSVPEIIAAISRAWVLQPGDLIYTGTPAGVGPVVRGDTLLAEVQGLPALQLMLV